MRVSLWIPQLTFLKRAGSLAPSTRYTTMLRVLLVITALVSAALAWALPMPALYAVAVGLLLIAGVLVSVAMRRRHSDVPEVYSELPEEEDEDMASLGIIEIKPKSRAAASSSDPSQINKSQSGEDEGEHASANPHAETSRPTSGIMEPPDPYRTEVVSAPVVGKARTRPPRARVMVAEASSSRGNDILVPALRSLRAAIDAYTVCLLRQEEAPLRYHVEAMVSQNSYARSGGSFATSDPLMAGHRTLVPIVYPRVGPNGFSKQKLGYYHEPINVRQVAMVPIASKKRDHVFILLVDTVHDGGLESAAVRVLLEQYGRLMAVLLDTAADGDLAEGDTDFSKPRREIIADEMERSRSMGYDLSLALVFLNKAEEDGVSNEDLDDLEIRFEGRLREVALDARIERFGELTFGVFYHGQQETVGAWAARIQEAFDEEAAPLDGGVSIGVVICGEQHGGPDSLRAHATAALQSAFETGECTIVE